MFKLTSGKLLSALTMQGGTQKPNFHRSLVSSVCLLPGSLGCWEDQVISLVGKCFQESRTKGYAGWAIICPQASSLLRQSWILAAFPAHHHHPPPGSSLLTKTWFLCQCYRLLPCISFAWHKSHLDTSGSGKFCLGLFYELFLILSLNVSSWCLPSTSKTYMNS